jgi:hypothetical protein
MGEFTNTAAKCAVCGDVVVSRHRHDFVTCRCRSIAVDGGGMYRRYVGSFEHFEETGAATPDGKEVRWDGDGRRERLSTS